MHAYVAGSAHKIMHDRTVQNFEPARASGFPDDDVRDVVGLAEGNHIVGDAPLAAGDRYGFTAKGLGQPERIGNPIALLLAQLQASPRFDIERRPGCAQPVGQTLGVAHETRRARVFADADENALAGGPRPGDRLSLHLREQLLVHALRRPTQREFAERRQLGRREKILQRALGLLRNIDLSFPEPCNQVLGREVDQFHGVGPVEHGIGNRFAHANPRDLGDDVDQAFDVLDVDRGVDVDAGAQKFLDIEIPLRVAAAWRIGMGKLVDKRDLRPTREDGVDIHFLKPLPFVVDLLARHDLEAVQERLGLLPPMRLHDSHGDVVSILLSRARRFQHRICLADARRGADINPELAPPAFLLPGRFKQGLGRRTLVDVTPIFRHQPSEPLSANPLCIPCGRPRLCSSRCLDPIEREVEF